VPSIAFSIYRDSTIFDACVKFLMQAAAVTLYGFLIFIVVVEV
jgi:hypothetical protein